MAFKAQNELILWECLKLNLNKNYTWDLFLRLKWSKNDKKTDIWEGFEFKMNKINYYVLWRLWEYGTDKYLRDHQSVKGLAGASNKPLKTSEIL